jgi:Raf kinase inhibitor-like YbhB/YbcL family protein
MQFTTAAFADNGVIPGEYAFAVMDPVTHIHLSTNRNPDFAWSGTPPHTRSLALLCHDPDVPSNGDDVNKEGRVVPASLPRVDFIHWALIDIPPSVHSITRGAHANGVIPRGKPGPKAPGNMRHGTNDYTVWFADDAEMGGDYHGYDGPCPPWNDEIPHRYIFTLYALDVSHLEVPAAFDGHAVRTAMQGHILAEATITGRYTLNPAVTI